MLLTCVVFRQQLSCIRVGNGGPAGSLRQQTAGCATSRISYADFGRGPSHTKKGRGERAAALSIPCAGTAKEGPIVLRFNLERFRPKQIPVRVKKTRQSKSFGSDSIRTEKSSGARSKP